MATARIVMGETYSYPESNYADISYVVTRDGFESDDVDVAMSSVCDEDDELLRRLSDGY